MPPHLQFLAHKPQGKMTELNTVFKNHTITPTAKAKLVHHVKQDWDNFNQQYKH